MKAIVVYESLWGNTAAIARAIAEGIGPNAKALSTAQATKGAIAGADLIVAGAPVFGFRLPTEKARESVKMKPAKGKAQPDFSHPAMRTWLGNLEKGNGRSAAFDTRIWWSPGGSTKEILREMEKAGYKPAGKGMKFIVKGTFGPLRDGELEKAKLWGAELAKAMG